MIHLDDKLTQNYLSECRDHLDRMEKGLLALEQGGPEVDEKIIGELSRDVHSIKAGAGFFDLAPITELAESIEAAVALIRSRQIALTSDRITMLLRAVDALGAMVDNPSGGDRADLASLIQALAGISTQAAEAVPVTPLPKDRLLRALLVEDDFSSRLVSDTFLRRYGICHVAVNGREAVDAVTVALQNGQHYDLICMDIMMPLMDGREAVRAIRAAEEARSILPHHGAKIVMTTALDDLQQVIGCFRELCDGYLVKPVDLAQLLSLMKKYELVN